MWRERAGSRLEPPKRRECRGQRDLLLEDDVDERAEPGGPIPERRRTQASSDVGEDRITACQLLDRGLERGAIQRVGQTTVPRSLKPADGNGSNGRPSAPRNQARAFSPSDGRW